MKTLAKMAAIASIVIGTASIAQAQSVSPQVPNPANPAPLNPIATDNSPLPQSAVPASPYYSGRSVAVDGPYAHARDRTQGTDFYGDRFDGDRD